MSNPFLEILQKTKKKFVEDVKNTPVNTRLNRTYTPKKRFRDDSTTGIVLNTISGIPKAGANVFRDILQGVARSVGTVGITAGNTTTRIANTLTGQNAPTPFEEEIPTDQNPFTRALFGGQPIRTLSGASKEAVRRANALASTVAGKEINPINPSFGLPLAVGGILLDLTGFGGKAGVKAFSDEIPEAFLKYVAKEKSPTVIEDTLKSIGLDDINAKNLAPKLAPTKSIDEVKNVLLDFDKTPKQENIFKNILKSPEEIPTPVKTTTPETNLISEAKKYKSAEEFVKAQGTFNPKNIEYHGTGKSFDKFMLGEEGSSGAGTENLGVFTTKSKEAAKFWAEKSAGVGKNGKVMEVYLDIKNPKIFKSQQALDDFLGDNPEQAIEALKKQGFDAIKYPESGIDKFPFDYWDELASKGVSFKNKLPDEPYMTTQVFDPKKIHIIGKDGVAGIKNKLANPLGEYPVLANSKIGEIQKINRLDDYSLTSKEWELQVHIENYANKNNLKFNEAKQEIIDILKTKSQLTDIWNKANENIFANPEATSDASRITRLRDSINEGKTLLKNKNLQQGEKEMIVRSIDNAQSKIGVEKKDGYTIEEISSDQIFNTKKPDIIKQATDARKQRLEDEGYIPKKELSEADKLIAEGKIRVVSRNGRDVYQIKKGKLWLNTRDEDSAVKQAKQGYKPPKPKEYTEKVQGKIDLVKNSLENVRDRLAEHPARPLLKFLKEGSFEDFKNPNLAKNQREAERIKAKNDKIIKTAESAFQDRPELEGKFDNPDVIRDVIEEYRSERQFEKSLIETRKELEKNYIPTEKKAIVPEKTQKEYPRIDTTEGEGRSIEIQANQAINILEGEPVSINVSLPNIIENTITPVKAKVHFLDTLLTTPHFVMEKIGFGKEAEMLRDASDAYWKELPKNIEVITKWSKEVSKEGNKNIFRFLDGEAITLKPEEKKVALEIKDWLQQWAKKLKLPEDNTITHYITHIFDKEFITKEFDEELAKIISDKIPGSVYDPFLLKRLGAKGYKQDTWSALDAYVKRATRKVHLDPVLEIIREKTGSSLDVSPLEKSQFNYIKQYLDNINMRPGDKEEAVDNFIKSIIGYKLGQRPTTAILGAFRKATFRGMLGLNLSSALRNLSQGINTYSVLGEKYTVLGYAKLFNKGAMEELAREGILNAGFIQDRTLSATKKAIEKMDKVLFTFFDMAEKINRGAAYLGAKAQYYARNTRKINGVEIMPQNIEEEAIKYAKKIVRQTQFIYDSIDTPVGMSSTLAKTFMQFQTFTTKQIEFLVQMTKDKNYWGLVRYAMAGLVFVYTIGQSFGMKPKELIPWFRFDWPVSLKLPIELTKAVFNTPDKYNQPRTIKDKISDVGKSAIGLIPAGSQIRKTIQGIMNVKEGGSFDKGGNLQFIQGQSLKEKAQSVLFGKYAGDEAQDYFTKVEDNAKELNKIKPIYEEVQKLDKEGSEDEAQAIVDELTDEEYELYKKYKSKETAKATLQGKKDILPVYFELKDTTDETKIQEILDREFPDTPEGDLKYKYYELVKEQVERDRQAESGTKPEYEDGEPQTVQGIIGTVFTYAKAIGVNPITAFNRIFTGQKIRYVANGAIVVERMSLNESQKIKKTRGGDSIELKLDHTIPLQLGGSNSEDNLSLVPTEIWKNYTPVENYLGKKLRNREISRKEAQELILKFKSGESTAEDIYNY